MSNDTDCLMAQAVTLLNRAQALTNSATQPFTRDQLAVIALTVRDVLLRLRRGTVHGDYGRLAILEAALEAQATRLAAFEYLVDRDAPLPTLH